MQKQEIGRHHANTMSDVLLAADMGPPMERPPTLDKEARRGLEIDRQV